MKKEEMPYRCLGDFEKEREKIIEDYKKGNYYKTSADRAAEKAYKNKLKYKGKGDVNGNQG